MRAYLIRHFVRCLGVATAITVGGLEPVITLVPGTEVWWFGTAAAAAALGLLSPSRRVRLTAAVFAAGYIWFTLRSVIPMSQASVAYPFFVRTPPSSKPQIPAKLLMPRLLHGR